MSIQEVKDNWIFLDRGTSVWRGACVVWALRGPRMEELAQRSPVLALELLRAAGAVMAVRMRANMTRQTPIS